MNPLTLTFDGGRTVLERAADAVDRGRLAPERAETMAEVEVGGTPSDVIYRENKLELLRYDAEAAGIEPAADHDIPILICYALINRPYILDLQPDRSVVRRLLEAGFDVYLIDWGEPSLLDTALGLHDYVDRYVDNCVDAVREDAGEDAVNLLGYCMGGTMSVMYAALYPEKVRNLGLMAAGLCFTGTGGVLELWSDEDYYDPGALADAYGNVPAEFLAVGFDMMDPVNNYVTKYVQLYDNLEDEDFVENFARMERWLADGIDLAGAVYEEFLEEIYQENSLYENELEIGGEHVDLGNVEMPVAQIVGEYDHLVPPPASKPFNDRVPSEDTTVFEASVGHIGLSVSRSAHENLWPSVAEWFAERSNGPVEADLEAAVADEVPDEDESVDAAVEAESPEPELESIEGIGPAYAERLREAGVASIPALAEADPAELAAESGIGEGRIRTWIERARERDDV